MLGARIEHYIPVLQKYEEKMKEKKQRKGAPIIKKRIKRKENEKYVTPFFDEHMDGHPRLEMLLSRKGKDNKHFYLYEVLDKKCTLVINSQMEKAIKDKDIVDIIIAQRSEKIVVKMADGNKVTLPLAKFDEPGVLYRGSGYTKSVVEEQHHHGKGTFFMARLFEAKEAGVEEWELEMMRMASKRKKKVKGEESGDFKLVMQAAAENMDWDQFEEDSKQILEDADQMVDDENIPMAVDSMEKTKHVNQKLKDGGEDVIDQLPLMREIPEVMKQIENGMLSELENVSGIEVLISGGRVVFVPGQMVKSETSEVFVPGQTIELEDGTCEYTPGVTIKDENDEIILMPGLIFGEEEQEPTFLPGESTITEEGQLQFEATEDDRPAREPSPTPPPKSPTPPPPPPKEKSKTPELFTRQLPTKMDPIEAYEIRKKKAEEEERKRRMERSELKALKDEAEIDNIRRKIRQKLNNFKIVKPDEYIPQEPVLKSKKLEELERSVNDGSFEDFQTRMILEKVRNESRRARAELLLNVVEPEEFGSNYDQIGHYPNPKLQRDF